MVGFHSLIIFYGNNPISSVVENMKARFNGIAALRPGGEILVQYGKIYGEELVIKEMQEINTGILWKGGLIPSPIRAAVIDVRNKRYRISNVVVNCEVNKTIFEASEVK